MLLALALAVPALAGEIQVVPRAPVEIVVDGLSIPMDASGQTMTAMDLQPGRHSVEARNAFGKTVSYMEVELAADEQVRFEFRKKALIHVATTRLAAPPPPVPAAPEPIVIHAASMEPAGVGISMTMSDGTETVSMGVSADAFGAGVVIQDSSGGSVAVQGGVTVTPRPQPQHIVVDARGPRPPPGGVPAPPALVPMAPGPFAALVGSMRAASFNDDKDSVLQTAVAHNLFSVAQVKELIATYDFDGSRVDAVRILRPAVVDPENAFLLADAFDFSSNAQEAQALFR